MYSQSGLKRLNSSGFVFHVIKWNLWEWLDFPATGRRRKAKKPCKRLLLCQQQKEAFFSDSEMTNIWWWDHCGWSTNRLQNKCLLSLAIVQSWCQRAKKLFFEMHIKKAAGVFVGGGFQSAVYSIMWHLWYRSAEWLIILTMALTALHRLAFDLIGERSHQQLRGWWVGNGLVLIYRPIITSLSGRTGGNEEGREGQKDK